MRKLAMMVTFGLGIAASAIAEDSLYAPACCYDVRRAGRPYQQAAWAVPNNTGAYDGYFVGGGAHTYCGQGRCPQQGTWGWDYVGRCAPPLVRLGWWHVPRKQGGTGSYEPDGPRLIDCEHGE